MRRREEGVVAVVTALVLVVMMGAVALTVDVGGMLYRRREMVNGADAAALAAALECQAGHGGAAATAEARRLFVANAPHAAGYTLDSIDLSQCALPSGTVALRFSSAQPLYFAPVLGLPGSKTISVSASGSWRRLGVTPPALVIPPGYKGKVFVCKYVGTPGGDERLQTGQNPTNPNASAVNPLASGWFNDAQGRSYVIALDAGQPDPVCPDSAPHVWLSA